MAGRKGGILSALGRHRRLALAICAALAFVPGLFALDVLLHNRGLGQGQELSCTYTSRCLPSYRNNSLCESLKIGTPEREIIFRLGQPEGAAGNTLYFEAGALERGPIVVELDATRRATRFVCRPAA